MIRCLLAIIALVMVNNFSYANNHMNKKSMGKGHTCECCEEMCKCKECNEGTCGEKACKGKIEKPLVVEDVETIAWEDAGPAFPIGSFVRNIEGRMNQKGCFAALHKMSKGYEIPSHKLSNHMHASVRSGVIQVTLDGKVHKLGSNSFMAITKDTSVQIKVLEDAVVQLEGFGPLEITYVNSEDDPRMKKEVKKNN